MSAADTQRVFEPFARSGHGQTPSGTGLGLTIAKMLTDLMGGEMSVHSHLGTGSTFSFKLFLPEIYTSEAINSPAPLGLAECSGYTGPRQHILVVDNEETDRQLLARWLEPLGFEVHLATHGEDALHRLQTGLCPAAVFMDLAMPGMDGWETLRHIRRLPLHPPPACAVVSANAFDKGLDNDVSLPPEDFLVKPVRRTELLAWLQQRLPLAWQYITPSPPIPHTPPPSSATASHGLPAEAIDSLRELAQLGYYRGFVKRLDSLQACHPEIAPWAQALKAQAREFRFEAILEQLRPLSNNTAPNALEQR